MKNVSSSTSHNTKKVWNYRIKTYVNANIMKAHIFIKWSMTSKVIKGHIKISKSSYFAIYYSFNAYVAYSLKNFSSMSTSSRYKFVITLKYDLKGHLISRPLLCQNLYRTFVYWPIWIKMCKNVNIIRTQFFIKLYMTF